LLLLGDAAHGIVPFFGQGMNLGFEDCSVLDELMAEHGEDWEGIFAKMTILRKPNADAIAAMALENFTEMRDKVGDARFLLEKQVEALIAQRYPSLYLSRYSMVTHTLIPYHLAQEAGKIQQAILRDLCVSISSPQEVDWSQVEALLAARWRPFVEAHPVLQQREV
jgi:kynurenine 3-monooxygenase